jgi:hypothetical protein
MDIEQAIRKFFATGTMRPARGTFNYDGQCCGLSASLLEIGQFPDPAYYYMDDIVLAVGRHYGKCRQWCYDFISGWDEHDWGHPSHPDAYELGKRLARELIKEKPCTGPTCSP